MSQTLDQIYIGNPITTNTSTDLMYFAQFPYTVGKDAAMVYSNFAAQFGAPYTAAALTEVNDTNVTLTLGGTPSTALLHATSITAGWTGTLAGSRGGLGAAITANNGGIYYSTGSAGALLAGTSTASQLLLSGASGAPSWSTTTYPSTNAVNTLLYASSANVMGALATISNGVLVTNNSGAPSWLANGTAGYVLTANSGAPASWQVIPTTGVTSITGTANEVIASASTGAVTLSLPQAIASTSSPTFSALTLTNPLTVGNGGTGVSSVTIAPTASVFAGWDSNKNLSANSFISAYATTATAASTTTLTVSSAYQQYFTGSTTQTVIMPVASTLVEGQSWLIVNNSTGVVTVESSGANSIIAMPASTQSLITCILNSGTSAASWNAENTSNVAGVTSITGTANQVIASSPSGSVTLSLPQSIATGSSPTFAGLTLGTSALTLGGSLTTSGAYASTFTMTGATNITFPTSGTLSTTTGTVTSVSGTSNRVTSTGGTTPVIDISGSYVGQSSITTLGTVSTGVWDATNVALAYGGTNASLTANNGGIFYSTASAGAILAGTSTADQLLLSGASGAPTWSTSTYPTTNAANTLLYASSANTMAALATANDGVLVTSNTGVPSWLANGTAGYVLTANSSAPPSWQANGYLSGAVLLAPSADQHITGASSLYVDKGLFAIGQASGGGYGQFTIYSQAASKGSLSLGFSDNSANYAITIINLTFGQSTSVRIPDPGVASANFLLTDSPGTQNITSGNIGLTNGSLTLGHIGGGYAGNMSIYPVTVSRGYITITCVNNTADYTIDIQNAAFGQSSTLTIADPGSSSATFAYTSSPSAGYVLQVDSDSGNATPSSGVVTLSGGSTGLTTSASSSTVNLTGTLKLSNGGTNAALTASNGGIFYSTSTAGAILAGTATANQMLMSGASAAPVWSTSTYPTTNAANTLLYASSANTMAALATANDGVLITSNTGVPSWLANGTAGYVLTANSGASPSWQAVSGGGVIVTLDGDSGSATGATVTISGGTTGLTTSASSATMNLTGTLALSHGGTNASLTASNGGIFYSTASAGAILAGTATAGQLLVSGASAAPAWTTTTYPSTNAVNTLLYASSANVMGALATANDGVLVTSNSGVPSWLANGTAGYVLTANSGAPPSWQVGGGGGGGITWSAAASTPVTAAVNTGYYITDASQVTITLPVTAAAGSIVAIVGNGAGGWILAPGSGQTIKVLAGSASTSITSAEQYDCIEVLCTVANTTWVTRSMMTTGFTVV